MMAMLKRKYLSDTDLICFCFYLFFVISPLQNFAHGYFDVGRPAQGMFFYNEELLFASLIPFSFLTTVALVFRQKLPKIVAPSVGFAKISRIGANFAFLITLSAFIMFLIVSGGLGNLLASRNEKSQDVVIGLPTLMLAIQVVSTHFVVINWKQSRGLNVALLQMLVCLALLGVSQNPFNTARFFLISSWTPIALIVLGGKVRTTSAYVFSFIFIVIGMPILSVTSRSSSGSLDDLSLSGLMAGVFKLPFLDVFDTLIPLVRIIDNNGYYYGMKAISTIFFFIPRSIWTGKATLTGLDVGEFLHWLGSAGTVNLSMFIGGDFYSDGGIVGVILGAALVAVGYSRAFLERIHYVNGLNLRSFMLISFMPILIRGPVGATIGLFFCEMVIYSLLYRILCRKTEPAGLATA